MCSIAAIEREPIFADDEDRQIFLRTLEEVCRRRW